MDTSSSVQQWIDKIPQQQTPVSIYSPQTKSAKRFLSRDWSFQSDESHCSSVDSVLEMRRPDPEEVLMELGFGPRRDAQNTCRIPERFLQPSTLLPHIDFNKFCERYGVKPPEQKSCPPSPLKKPQTESNNQ